MMQNQTNRVVVEAVEAQYDNATESAAHPDRERSSAGHDCAIYHADSTVSSVLTKDVADNLRRGRIRKNVLGCVTPRT